MSRRFKTRGGKTLKKKLKRDRRKKRITLKKRVKSRRKYNTVKKMVKSRRKYKKKAKPRRTLRARGAQKQAAGGDVGAYSYQWVDEGMVLKGYIKNITTDPEGGQFVIVHTQMGEGGGFDDVMFLPEKWRDLEKTKMNSDETKNLKEKAARWAGRGEDWDNGDIDGDTASTNQDLSRSDEEAWRRDAAEAAEVGVSDDEDDNTVSTRGFFGEPDDEFGGEIEGQR